jgi:hypothetical protein
VQAIGVIPLHNIRRNLHDEIAEKPAHMLKGIFCELRRLVFGSVILEKLIGCELDRFPPLFTGFLFDDLDVALLQPFTLAAFLFDGLLFVSRAGGTAAPPPLEDELVKIELTVKTLIRRFTVGLPDQPHLATIHLFSHRKQSSRNSSRAALSRLAGLVGFSAPRPPGWDSKRAVVSPSFKARTRSRSDTFRMRVIHAQSDL